MFSAVFCHLPTASQPRLTRGRPSTELGISSSSPIHPQLQKPQRRKQTGGSISGCALLSPCRWKALCTQDRHCSLLGLFFLREGLDDFLLLGLQAFLAALPSLLGFGPASLSLVTARRVCECLGIVPDSQEKAFPAGPALLALLVCHASC